MNIAGRISWTGNDLHKAEEREQGYDRAVRRAALLVMIDDAAREGDAIVAADHALARRRAAQSPRRLRRRPRSAPQRGAARLPPQISRAIFGSATIPRDVEGTDWGRMFWQLCEVPQ
jgi:hypothetical protein